MDFIRNVFKNLVYYTSPALTAAGARHMFCTRLGGVSEGHLESLNFGLSLGDERERVYENYRIAMAALESDVRDLVLTRQVHEDHVRVVTRADTGNLFHPTPEGADGLASADDVTLGAFYADCVVMLLFDPVAGVSAAVHAGWRGTAKGIARRAVEAMAALGARPEDIRAGVGPAIGRCCFETDADVPEAIAAAFGVAADGYIERAGSKYHVDLKGLNAMTLGQSGLVPEHVDVCRVCTMCTPEEFWSHRLTKGKRGVHGAFIVNHTAQGGNTLC